MEGARTIVDAVDARGLLLVGVKLGKPAGVTRGRLARAAQCF
jgi:hypothetical protein